MDAAIVDGMNEQTHSGLVADSGLVTGQMAGLGENSSAMLTRQCERNQQNCLSKNGWERMLTTYKIIG